MEPSDFTPQIANVYHFGNGMVMVFDADGQQVPEYQGRYEDVIDKLRAVYSGPIIATDWVNPHAKSENGS